MMAAGEATREGLVVLLTGEGAGCDGDCVRETRDGFEGSCFDVRELHIRQVDETGLAGANVIIAHGFSCSPRPQLAGCRCRGGEQVEPEMLCTKCLQRHPTTSWTPPGRGEKK